MGIRGANAGAKHYAWKGGRRSVFSARVSISKSYEIRGARPLRNDVEGAALVAVRAVPAD